MGTKILLQKYFNTEKEVTENEIQEIYYFNIKKTLEDTLASVLLRGNMELNRRGDKVVALQMLDIYEKCKEYMNDPSKANSDELGELGLEYSLEMELKAAIENGENFDIKICIQFIQENCSNEIEASPEYTRYKEALISVQNSFNK